jgi:hypothetical protein
MSDVIKWLARYRIAIALVAAAIVWGSFIAEAMRISGN